MSASSSDKNVLGHFFLNYKHILIDEIALEGLEGIGLDLLWRRIEHRISTLVTEKMKARFWQSLLNTTSISFFELSEPLPYVEIRDRFLIVDQETGDLKDPDDYLDGPYEYSPIPNEYGSSKYYYTRRPIPTHHLMGIPFGKIVAGYGDSLILVATLEERWKALAKHVPITCLQHMTPIQYCILELIGKSRENGQMSIGKTNLLNIIKEPKNLFYNRRLLHKLDLIKMVGLTQTIGPRAVKSLLLRLNRFHKPMILSVPKTGKIHKIIEYLSKCPRYAAKAEVMLNLGLYNRMQTKKIRKNNNVLDFIELDDDEEPAKKKFKKTHPSMQTKRRFMCIVSKSDDESSHSEDETPTQEAPVKYQYKIGVSLMRQAYERFLDAGLKGISQTELGQMLGTEFYTTRMLCRILKAKKIVREFFEDKGRQRISRYVAVAIGQDDANYAQEKKKFLDYMIQNHEGNFETQNSELIVPDIIQEAAENLNEQESRDITEVAVTTSDKLGVQSLIESKKCLTLRQLKFGNGVIKIVKERQFVTGFQTLSNLVAKEINEPPMVTKALKSFLQKLVAAGQIKIYRVKWPGPENDLNFMNLICAPHIKATDPIVRSKYKEVQLRAMAKKLPHKKDTLDCARPLTMYINPRYMKIQKLHEFIIDMTYFDRINFDSNLPRGFLSMTDLMPEMTVKFAISNMSTSGIADISYLRILDEHLPMKLKDAPPEISHAITKCKSLRNAMRLNLKALAMYGLIQLIYQPDIQTEDYTNNTLISFVFFVNRHATLLNTTGNWPREIHFESLERRYYFGTIDDVKNYWSDAYDISVATKMTLTENRTKKTLSPPVRREEEVHIFDNGSRYGDGKGPCGLDSCFHLEIARLWKTYFVKQRDAKPLAAVQVKKKIPLVKIPKLAKSKSTKAPKKKKAPKVKTVMKLKTVTRGRKRIPEATVTWTKEEDFIIVLCQAAITIASPSSQPGCLRVRNVVAKDILTLCDAKKTQSICHRRALMIQLNPTLMHEKDKLLNEMRRRRHLIIKYEGLIKKLRLRHSTNMTKFMNEARLPVLELVWLIWQVSKSESYNRKMPCVALSVWAFNERFTIVPATANKIYNIYKAPELSVLRESVFLTVMLTLNQDVKSETARKIYGIFKLYPENSLRVAVDQLRRAGAISAKEKLFNNQMHRLHLEDIVQSAYKISANYQRRWIGRLNSEFAVSLSKMIDAELPTTNIKGSAELNCILCELQASDLLEILTATKPAIVAHTMEESFNEDEHVNVIDIETKHKLRSGGVTWRAKPEGSSQWDMKTVASCYQDLEYQSFLGQLKAVAVVVPKEDLQYDMECVILCHLEQKGKEGSTFKELEEITSYDTKTLVQRLTLLESEGMLKRVGLNDNILILVKFIEHWALKVHENYLIVTPWFTLDFDIRYDILLEWAGVIVNKIFEYPGCSIAFLSDSFELVTCRAVQDACSFLEHVKCISIKIVKCRQVDLFSDDDEEPEASEYHPYESTANIMCFPVKNSITRYVHLRKTMLQNYVKERNT